MDNSRMAFHDHMGADEASGTAFPDIDYDFDSLMANDNALAQELETLTHCNHDSSSCLKQGCYAQIEPRKLQKRLERGSRQKQRIQAKAHARAQSSVSTLSDTQNTWNQPQAFGWDNFFTDNTVNGVMMPASPSGASHWADCASAACSSHCDVDCQSQCGETGQGVCCDDDDCGGTNLCVDEACQGAADPCTNANCNIDPAVTGNSSQTQTPITDGDKAAAVALASFGGPHLQGFGQTMLDPSSAALSNPQQSRQVSLADCCFQQNDYSNIPVDPSFSFNNYVNYWTPELQLASHILQFHGPDHHHDHARPCIADNPSQLMATCSLPRLTNDNTATNDPFAHQGHNHECGFQVQDPTTFAHHVWQEHRSFLMPNMPFFTPNQPSHVLGQMCAFHDDFPSISHDSATTAHGHRYSSSASPMTNLSVGTTLPTTPTSVITPPSLETDLTPAIRRRSRTRTPTPIADQKTQAMSQEDQYECRWLLDGKTMCGMMFTNNDDLQKHCKENHLAKLKKPDPGFTCPWKGCSRTAGFGQKSKLERHLQTHTGFKPVGCHICGAKLSAKQSLDQHMRTHTGEMPWKCTFPGCNRAFKQQSACTMHMRVHTKEKPLACEICGKRFAESSNLSKHRRIHNVKGKFACKLCGKDFHRLDQLRRHMGTNHKDRPEVVAEFLQKTQGGRTAKQKVASASQGAKTLQEWAPEEAMAAIEQEMDGMNVLEDSEVLEGTGGSDDPETTDDVGDVESDIISNADQILAV